MTEEELGDFDTWWAAHEEYYLRPNAAVQSIARDAWDAGHQVTRLRGYLESIKERVWGQGYGDQTERLSMIAGIVELALDGRQHKED